MIAGQEQRRSAVGLRGKAGRLLGAFMQVDGHPLRRITDAPARRARLAEIVERVSVPTFLLTFLAGSAAFIVWGAK